MFVSMSLYKRVSSQNLYTYILWNMTLDLTPLDSKSTQSIFEFYSKNIPLNISYLYFTISNLPCQPSLLFGVYLEFLELYLFISFFTVVTYQRVENEETGQAEEQYREEEQDPNQPGMPSPLDHISPIFHKVIVFCF